MGTASHSQTINAGVDAIWAYLGDFNGLPRWHPDVKSSTLEDNGTVRRLALHNGAEVIERLLELDPAARRCRYSIIGGPLPVARHEAVIHIRPNGHGSMVDWRCEFETGGPPESELVPIFQHIFQTGLTRLKSILEV
jgi:hypothetical protein